MEKKREIKIASPQEALKRMRAFLFANMLDDGLELGGEKLEDLRSFLTDKDTSDKSEADDQKLEALRDYVRLAWLYRDADDKKKVGCPCFVCRYQGVLPGGQNVDAIVYAKVFGDKELHMVKMHVLDEKEENYSIVPIADDMVFDMYDEEQRFADGKYVYKDGIVQPVE